MARYLPISNEVVLVVAAVSPYLTAAGLVAMILFAVGQAVGADDRGRGAVRGDARSCRCRGSSALRRRGVPSVSVRVLTANLGLGQADPTAVIALARDTADVLVVQEMTPGLAAAM